MIHRSQNTFISWLAHRQGAFPSPQEVTKKKREKKTQPKNTLKVQRFKKAAKKNPT